MKRITVEILCLLVDTDGTPVDIHGEMLTGKAKPVYEWDKRRISANRFCPTDMRNPKRRKVQYRNVTTAEPLRCNCHKGRLRLM